MTHLNKIIALSMVLSMGLAGCDSNKEEPVAANEDGSSNMAVDAATKMATMAINTTIEDEGNHIDIKSNGQEITVSNGNSGEQSSFKAGLGMEMPEDFPSDVPVPDDYILFSVINVDGQHMLTGISKQDIKTLIEQYDKELKDSGWKTGFKTQTPEGGMFYYQKEERIINYRFARITEKELDKYPGYVSNVSIVAGNS